MIDTVDQLVEHLGGTTKAAEFFDVTAPAVSNWKSSGRLPAWVMPRVIAWASDNQATLSDSLIETLKPPGGRRKSDDISDAAE